MPKRLLIGAAALVAAVAVVVTALADDGSGSLPDWVPTTLRGVTIGPASEAELRVSRSYAVEAARLRAVAGGPSGEPEAYPSRVSGRVLRAQPASEQIGPTGEVEDLPAWLVVWRGVRQDAFTGPAGGDDQIVDAVFLVDGVTGACCLETLFLAGGSRLR